MMEAVAARPGGEVLDRAAEGAARGTFGAGTLVHRVDPSRIAVALVLEPEDDAAKAAQMLLVGQVAAASALAALAPPETEIGVCWGGALTLNGARCGGVRGRLDRIDEPHPAWLAVEVALTLAVRGEPGRDPSRTGVADEIGPFPFEPWIASLARHWKLWIHRWESEGLAPIGSEWKARMVADPTTLSTQTILGLDQGGSAIVRSGDGIRSQSVLDLWEGVGR